MIGDTFWSADLHFLHINILTLGNGRPFDTIEEHDETIIERWNANVTSSDVVHVLGDVAMGPIEQSLALCKRLRGRKYLVCGNHDRPFAGLRGQTPEKMAAWSRRYVEEGGFVAVNTWAHWRKSRIATPQMLGSPDLPRMRVLTSHFPASETPFDERYADWRPTLRKGEWLLHGHIHDAWGVRPETREINVGVDAWGFEPVSSETLRALIEVHS